MATVEQTWMKVQRLLTGPMGLKVSINADTMQVRFKDSSTAVHLKVVDWGKTKEGEPETLVHLWAPVLSEVSPSPALFEWVAREGGSQWFGHVRVVDEEPAGGKVRLIMEHTLLGDFLDERELGTALFGLEMGGDKLDDQLKGTFGGKRWSDD